MWRIRGNFNTSPTLFGDSSLPPTASSFKRTFRTLCKQCRTRLSLLSLLRSLPSGGTAPVSSKSVGWQGTISVDVEFWCLLDLTCSDCCQPWVLEEAATEPRDPLRSARITWANTSPVIDERPRSVWHCSWFLNGVTTPAFDSSLLTKAVAFERIRCFRTGENGASIRCFNVGSELGIGQNRKTELVQRTRTLPH